MRQHKVSSSDSMYVASHRTRSRWALTAIVALVLGCWLTFALAGCGGGGGGESKATRSAAVTVPSSITAARGAALDIPVSVSRAPNLAGIDFTLTYDPTVLTFVHLTSASGTSGFRWASRVSGGRLRVAGATPVTNSDADFTILSVRFMAANVSSATTTKISVGSATMVGTNAKKFSQVAGAQGTVSIQ